MIQRFKPAVYNTTIQKPACLFLISLSTAVAIETVQTNNLEVIVSYIVSAIKAAYSSPIFVVSVKYKVL
jgi:hypothetical protein